MDIAGSRFMLLPLLLLLYFILRQIFIYRTRNSLALRIIAPRTAHRKHIHHLLHQARLALRRPLLRLVQVYDLAGLKLCDLGVQGCGKLYEFPLFLRRVRLLGLGVDWRGLDNVSFLVTRLEVEGHIFHFMIQVTYSQILIDPFQLPSLPALLLLSKSFPHYASLSRHLSLSSYNHLLFCFLHLQHLEQFLADNQLWVESRWIGQELLGGALRISLQGEDVRVSLYGKKGRARVRELQGKELFALFAEQKLLSPDATQYQFRRKLLRQRLSALTFIKAFKRQKALDFQSALTVTQYSEGQLVALKAHQADRLFFLLRGRLRKEEGQIINPGGWFGVQSFERSNYRQNVQALQSSFVAWIKLTDFHFVVGSVSSTRSIINFLGSRSFERGTIQEVIELLDFWSLPTRQLKQFRFYLVHGESELKGLRALDKQHASLRICDSSVLSTTQLLEVNQQVLRRLVAFRLDFQRILLAQNVSLEQILK